MSYHVKDNDVDVRIHGLGMAIETLLSVYL